MIYNVALDIGTSGIRMALRGHGIVYRQSAAIALRGGHSIATGNEALRLQSRTPHDISIRFPMQCGLVADEQALAHWLKHLVRHAQTGGLRGKPKILMAVPPTIQPAPLRLLVALALEAGAGACAAVRSDLAAAVGAPVDIYTTKCVLLCQLGAGFTSVSAICGGRVVVSRALPFGMALVDQAIVRRLRKKYGLIVSAKGAEELKSLLASVGTASAPSASIAALDAKTGFPAHFEIESLDMKDAASPLLDQLCELIYQVLVALPPQLSADAADAGLILTGGGAQLFGMVQRIADEFSLPCHLVEDPPGSVIRGLSHMLESRDRYDSLVISQQNALQRSGE